MSYFKLTKCEKIDFLDNAFKRKKDITVDQIFLFIDREEDITVKCALYLVAGRIGNETDVLRLSKGLKEKDPKIREHVLKGLALIQSEFTLPFILDMLEDESQRVRITALRCAQKMNLRSTLDFIELRLSNIKKKDILKRYINLLNRKENLEMQELYKFAIMKYESEEIEDFELGEYI